MAKETKSTEASTQTMGQAAARYNSLTGERTHFIQRAVKSARLTIPTLFQENTTAAKNMKIKDPAQSLGSRGVNNLAAKMILSLVPLNTPFYKFNVDGVVMNEAEEAENKETIDAVKKGLTVLETNLMQEIENSGDVTTVHEACRHLIVVGNAGLYVGEDSTRFYSLNKYVVVRGPDGSVLEAVIEEDVATLSLDPAFLNTLNEVSGALGKEKMPSTEATLKMYTHIKREGEQVIWHQEINGVEVPGSRSEVPEEGNPWFFLRFTSIDGEDYGRSYVEDYLGDLETLEVLTKAVTDTAVAAAKTVWMVRANGSTSARSLTTAKNNSVISGNADDVTCLRMDKAADLRVALETIASLKQALAYAFMMNAEVMRDAERVTAEEVRFVAQELDDSLGGVYSLLSREFQSPYVKRRLFLLRKDKNYPKLPDAVSMVIVTGFAALGRGHDSEKLLRAIDKIKMLLDNPRLEEFISIDEAINRILIADGIPAKDLQITEEERAQARQAAQAADMAKTVAPEALRQAGPAIQQQLMNQAEGDIDVPQEQA